jgi:TPR repeat protein
MVDLGYLYARGKGVERNDALAVGWYRRAVAEAMPRACITLR